MRNYHISPLPLTMPPIFARACSHRLYALCARCTAHSLFPIMDMQTHATGCQYLVRLSPTHHVWVDGIDLELVVFAPVTSRKYFCY